jgi:peroxiredoxin
VAADRAQVGDAGDPTPVRPAFAHRPARHGLIGPFGARQIAAALGAVALVAFVVAIVTAPLGSPVAGTPPDPRATAYAIAAPTEGLRAGDRAPELTIARSDGSTFTLTDLDGRPVSLASLRGKAVWIDFWASWCPPCQAETPVIRAANRAYRDRGLAIIAISVQESSVDDVRAYARTYDLGYTVAADLAGDIFRLYRVYALPTQFFIDPDGVIRSVVQGPLDAASAARQVEAILPGTAVK